MAAQYEYKPDMTRAEAKVELEKFLNPDGDRPYKSLKTNAERFRWLDMERAFWRCFTLMQSPVSKAADRLARLRKQIEKEYKTTRFYRANRAKILTVQLDPEGYGCVFTTKEGTYTVSTDATDRPYADSIRFQGLTATVPVR